MLVCCRVGLWRGRSLLCSLCRLVLLAWVLTGLVVSCARLVGLRVGCLVGLLVGLIACVAWWIVWVLLSTAAVGSF